MLLASGGASISVDACDMDISCVEASDNAVEDGTELDRALDDQIAFLIEMGEFSNHELLNALVNSFLGVISEFDPFEFDLEFHNVCVVERLSD